MFKTFITLRASQNVNKIHGSRPAFADGGFKQKTNIFGCEHFWLLTRISFLITKFLFDSVQLHIYLRGT